VADITFGSVNTFAETWADGLSVAMLDASHFVAAYRDRTDSFYGKARVGSISGTTISYGAINQFETFGIGALDVKALDATHFVIAFKGDDNHAWAIIGEVSGTTISSYGTAVKFLAANCVSMSVAVLDATHFVIGYRDAGDSNHGYAIIGATSATTISSYGTPVEFNAAGSAYVCVAVLSSTNFAVAYEDEGDSSHGKAIIGATSGTTISSFGSAVEFSSAAAVDFLSAAALDSTHFVISYQNEGDSDHGYAIIGLTSGTTISSFGTAVEFNGAATSYISVTEIDSANFVVAYRDSDTYGKAIAGLLSGTTIDSYGTEATFYSESAYYQSTAMLTSTHFVIGYMDNADNDYGKAIIGELSPAGFSGKVIAVASPAKVNGVASPAKVMGV